MQRLMLLNSAIINKITHINQHLKATFDNKKKTSKSYGEIKADQRINIVCKKETK